MNPPRKSRLTLRRAALSLLCRRGALTLLELLVVLVILTIVATVAVNSLQPRVESARFDQTRSLLSNIKDSAVGALSLRQTDGTPHISGFVADIGRLPIPTPTTSFDAPQEGLELRELWDSDTLLAHRYPFLSRPGPSKPEDYSHIQIPCGWRGPYLHLPMGQTSVLDPWSRPFEVISDERNAVSKLVWQPVPPFDQALTCDLTIGFASVIGTINLDQSESSNVEVVLLAPDPQTSLTELAVFADEDSNDLTFTFSEVPIGLRALHIKYDGGEKTKYVLVPHGGLSLVIDLDPPSGAVP